MLFIILALTGFFVGLLSAFFGVGGGVLIVPVLYGLFPEATPASVIGTSLTVIFLNSLVNVYNFKRLGRKPKMNWGSLLILGMMVGVIISSHYLQQIDPKTARLIFGCVLVLTALRTVLYKVPDNLPEEIKNIEPLSILTIFITGLFGGLIAGLTGLGGGIVMVPLLITFHRMPLPWVPVYSNLAMIGGTFVGLLRYSQIESPNVIKIGFLKSLQYGSDQFGIAFIIFLGAALSSPLGARLSQRVSKENTKRLFMVLLIVMSARIFYSVFSS